MSKFDYEKALLRLREISAMLEAEVNDINMLHDLVKESAGLIKKCQAHLQNTEKEIEKTLDGLDDMAE